MMTDTLSDFKERCRCCLEDAKGDVYIKITKFIEDRFLEFTSTNVRFIFASLRSVDHLEAFVISAS